MPSKDEAKREIRRLLDVYLKDTERWNKLNEADTCSKFIEPVFRALGWDFTEDVSKEVSIRNKESTKKRADYVFNINGITKLIVEAKAIKADLNKQEFTDQVIGYAYNKSCSWAVLTDFEGIKIFLVDEEGVPFKDIILTDLDTFDENFENLWLVSKESFLTNLIEKKAEGDARKVRKIKIDEQLFHDLSVWREHLYKDIKATYSSKYSDEIIEEIVQRIIDRLIFIRKVEDAQITEPVLKRLLRQNNTNVYKELKKIFAQFNEDYNSKLFGETEEDEHEADRIDVSNKTIVKVIEGMYVPSGRRIEYNFAAIDADILGNIYEQYLGHILKKHKVVEGHAHRKEQGIYYTPTYIVDYIVKNTVGELLKNKKINPEKIRILDPTCGSGSFLIKAFDCVNNYWKKKEGTSAQTSFDISGGILKRRERIAKENIFGVDLDPKAVEIAQLNLLLKLAERRHRLPTLRNNIKVGNSFIEDLKFSDSPFIWNDEFEEILKSGGFDVIVGNPPYVHQKGERDAPTISFEERDYYREKYETVLGSGGSTRGGVKINLFIPYTERCVKLLREGGRLGFIVHKNILKVESYKFLRKFILQNCVIEKIVDLGAGVFKGVTGETVILVLRKESNQNIRNRSKIQIIHDISEEHDLARDNYSVNTVNQNCFLTTTDNMFTIYMNPETLSFKKKMESKSSKLEDVVRIVSFGLNTVNNKKYFGKEKIDEKYKRAVMGRDIDRWVIKNPNNYVCYDKKVLSRIGDEPTFLAKEKLIMQRIGAGIICAYDDKQYYCYNSTNMVLPKSKNVNIKYILALLNSKLMNAYYRLVFATKAGLTVNVTQGYLSQLPVKIVSEDRQEKIATLVNEIIETKRRLIGMEKTDEKTRLETLAERLENKLDGEIFSIYMITEAERKIIEESLK